MNSWKDHFNAMKAGPSLNFGKSTTITAPQHVPTTQLGWKDHFEDQRKAKMMNPSTVGETLASHLTDDADHQAQIAGAITNFMTPAAGQ